MAEKGLKVEFEEFDPEEDPELKKNPSIKNFFVVASASVDKKENRNPKSERAKFFKDLKLESASLNGFFKRNWLIYLLFEIEINENKKLLLQNKMQLLYCSFIFFNSTKSY